MGNIDARKGNNYSIMWSRLSQRLSVSTLRETLRNAWKKLCNTAIAVQHSVIMLHKASLDVALAVGEAFGLRKLSLQQRPGGSAIDKPYVAIRCRALRSTHETICPRPK